MTTTAAGAGERWHEAQSEIARLIAAGEWPHEEMRHFDELTRARTRVAELEAKR